MEQTAEDAAPSVTNAVETTSLIGPNTGTTSDEMVENRDEDKLKNGVTKWKVKKKRKGKDKRYHSSDDNEYEMRSDLRVILPFHELLTNSVDYETPRLRNPDYEYTSQVAQKITKCYNRLGFQVGDSNFTKVMIPLRSLTSFKSSRSLMTRMVIQNA